MTAPSAASPHDRFTTINGLRIHYLDWQQPGDPARPPLVLLHSIGRLAHAFDPFAPSFCDGFRVIALDMRGQFVSDLLYYKLFLVE